VLWDQILAAVAQSWPPFALVTGLLLIGTVADDDGLFAAAGGRVAAVRLGPRALLLVCSPSSLAVLFSAQPPAHPAALLVGLDLGPNVAVTGSLSAFLWLRAARSVDADASVVTYSRLGLLLVPLTIAGALGVS